MIILILQVAVGLVLAWVSFDTARVTKQLCVKLSLIISGAAVIAMSAVTIAQFSGAGLPWFQAAYRNFILVVLATELVLIAALRGYGEWK